MSKYALVVVDVQNDYFPGGKWTLHEMNAAADNVAKLLAATRASGDHVIHIRHEFDSLEAPFFVPGSEGAKINAKAQNVGAEPVILKQHVNSFRETNLKARLDQLGVRHVVICGAMSHMCVDAATRAASDYGYNVTVIHDACASRDVEFNGVKVPAELAHAAFMSSLGFAYAKVISTEEFVASKSGQPAMATS